MPESETVIPQTHEAPAPVETVPGASVPTTGASVAPNGEAPSEDEVLEALKSVIDPELGINIVDLGLVYEVDVAEDGDVDIQYTLTTMGCPIGPLIEDQMRAFLAPLSGIGEVRPEMVLRPAWTPEMMSDEAKAAMGMF
ncbi:MAG TPA: metal-sulfur cluster assembly factor [Actinomycetota bacterium]|nr:metal-sulfur cluster assembly factor [Actinomycetota bacterium]